MAAESELKSTKTVADAIAQFLSRRGVTRLFGLCGGHIQPIWDRAARIGIEIIDVRDERAAVHMAHAHSTFTGSIGVALVTGGPGASNAMTGIVNAHSARAPVLVISGIPPRPQERMGAFQDLAQAEMLRPVTRYARTVRDRLHVLPALDEAVAQASGIGGEPGPTYLDFPTDLLREELPEGLMSEEHLTAKPPPIIHPDTSVIEQAVKLLWGAKRPLVISGSGAMNSEQALIHFLDALGAAYLDTGESRGLVPEEHASVISALRSRAFAEADVVLTVGRRLDAQLGYGSPAVFQNATFVRIGEHAGELRDNRRGAVEVFGTPNLVLEALIAAAGDRQPATDTDAMVIADGGDILSFARVGLNPAHYLDPGAFGCLGVGVPFGIAAALAFPERQVIVISGDGSFGFNAMEIDTAVRHGAKAVIVVANNGGWNIERYDQTVTYGGNLVGSELRYSDYAALARALGAHGERVTRAEELPNALEQALAQAPALLDVHVTRDAISGDGKSGLAWVPDTQALEAWDTAEKEWRRKQSSN
jgi:acetolactate synthase-1/2/3 large subunit